MNVIFFSKKLQKCFTTKKGARTIEEVNGMLGTDDVVEYDTVSGATPVIVNGDLTFKNMTIDIQAERDRISQIKSRIKTKLKLTDEEFSELKQALR